MAAPRMLVRTVTRLPVPLLFMAMSIGIFALMVVFTFASATTSDGDRAAVGPHLEADVMVTPDAGTW